MSAVAITACRHSRRGNQRHEVDAAHLYEKTDVAQRLLSLVQQSGFRATEHRKVASRAIREENDMKRKAIQVGALVLLAIGGVSLGKSAARILLQPPDSVALETQMMAPSMVLGEDRSGASVSVPIAARTRPVAIFALSVQCPYCQRNLPNWREIARAVNSQGTEVELLVLSTSTPEETAAYLEANQLPRNVVYVDAGELQALGLPGVPGTVAVTPGDPTVRKWVGVLEASDVSKITAWVELFVANSIPGPGRP